MALENLANFGLDNGFLSNSTITWTKANLLFVRYCGIQWMANSMEILMISFSKIYLKITNLKLQPYIPGTKELKSIGGV